MTFFLIFCAQIARFNVILEPFQEVCIHRPLCTYFHLKGQLVQILAGAARWGGRGWVQFRSGKGKKGKEVERLVQTENASQVSRLVGWGEEERENLLHAQLCPLALPSSAQFATAHLYPCPGALLCCLKIRKQILQSMGAFAADVSRRN